MLNGLKSHLEQRVERLKALYHMYGAQGLKEFETADIRLLLSAKQIALADTSEMARKDDGLRSAKLRLELEVKDLGHELKERSRGREIGR